MNTYNSKNMVYLEINLTKMSKKKTKYKTFKILKAKYQYLKSIHYLHKYQVHTQKDSKSQGGHLSPN